MKKTILIIMLVTIALVLITGGIFFFTRWNRPMGVSLGLPSPTPGFEDATHTPKVFPTETNTSEPDGVVAESPMPALTATEPQPLCGGPPIMCQG